MDRTYHARIQELAYFLWEEAGCPEGRSGEFWNIAQKYLSINRPKPNFNLYQKPQYYQKDLSK